MTMWMNNTLKVDTSYIPYFVIASGFVCYKMYIQEKKLSFKIIIEIGDEI